MKGIEMLARSYELDQKREEKELNKEGKYKSD